MTPSELELWSRKVVDATLNGQRVEDSRVELKSKWIVPQEAARRLAGHANAARGENILWVFGIDENNERLTPVDPTEKGDWYRSVEKYFDGYAPRLLLDVNFEVNSSPLASLYFDTQHEPPFVIKGTAGGYPEYTVPWRTGTAIRAASRAQLLSLLVPVRTILELKRELEFNRTVARGNFGGLFRTDHFIGALGSGLLDSVTHELRNQILETYAKIDLSNQKTTGYHQFSGNWGARGNLGSEVIKAFSDARDAIEALSEALYSASQT